VNIFRRTFIGATLGRPAPPVCLIACVAGALGALHGCRSASPPELPGLDAAPGTADAGNAGWADTIVAVVAAGATLACTQELPACGTPASGCGADAALGPADGQAFALAPNASLLVAFRCASILDHGGAGADLTVWTDVPAGGAGVVEVSPDGDSFATVGALTGSDPSFSIAGTGASVERFVRVSNVGEVDLPLDAIEAR
jgi:hypothetical protein